MNYYETFLRRIFTSKNFAPLRLCVFALIFAFSFHAQTRAPGAPGKDAQWATAGKQGVGTSANLESKVWFTLAEGVMTEVYYPDVTVANVHKLEFVVVNPKTRKVETEQDASIKTIRVNGNLGKLPAWLGSVTAKDWIEFDADRINPLIDALYFTQITVNEDAQWAIIKSYIADPKSNTVMIRVRFGARDKNLRLYVYYDPSLANSGMGDTAWNDGAALLAQDKDISSALLASAPLSEMSNGFYQTSDGLEQLKAHGKIVTPYSKAENGNVVQMAKINFERGKEVDFVLSFGKTPGEALETAKNSLKNGFDKRLAQYKDEWRNYVKTLPNVGDKYRAQFNMAAMQLKAHEDKRTRGANIASLSIPWGGDKNANENTVGGYHLIWSRDLYQVATAFMALGDKAAAIRALDFLFKVQQKPDGSFPQNSYLDGKPFWGSLQLDEVAFPLILAYQLGRSDKEVYENHVKRAADFIVKNGPVTPQERWEEEGGYSPSTIAAEIAGLVCAAEIARKNNDSTSADLWLKTADQWQANIEKWTVTTNGKHSKEPYYLRITQGKPDSGEKLEINNGAGFFDEREIVDAGFLELVRLGIKSPDDRIIQNSLKVIDETIRVNTPGGDAFYRYNHDGYGEMDDGRRWNFDGKYTGKGRLWALLSGERGQYELAFANYGKWKTENGKLEDKDPNLRLRIPNPELRLDAMLAFAGEGLMIPEQIWDLPNVPKNIDRQFVPELKFGEGTGSATPLAWSMAQFIRLAVNLREGKNTDTPDVVYNRYVLGKQPEASSQKTKADDEDITEIPLSFKVGVQDIDKFFGNSDKKNRNPLFVNCGKDFIADCKNPKNEMHACFSIEGEHANVEIAGDFTGWKPQKIYAKRDEKSGIVSNCLTFAKTARVEYKLIVDGKWITDPLNPEKTDNGVGGENSVFTMPDYKPTEWDKGEDCCATTKIPLQKIEIKSEIYDRREIQVYAPVVLNAGLNSLKQSELPVLYLQDGSAYINRAKAVKIQENLVAAGKIKPFIMVFLDPKDRTKEYWASDDYAKFVAAEVVPFIDEQYKTIKNRDGRAIMGASLGGITSVHVGLKYAEIFGRIGGQSSSFWIDDERVVGELEKLDAAKNKFKFYFDDGTLEGTEDSRAVVKLLKDKGFAVTYNETEAGHNWTAWRDRLADAFTALWN